MKKYEIVDETNNRIDKAICILDKDLTRVAVQRMIDDGKILVNGNKVKPSHKLNKGDIVTVEPEIAIQVDIKPQEIPLEIVYEDNDILVVNKEKGMVVHPGNGNSDRNISKCCNGKVQR